MTYASSRSISHLKQNRASSFTYLNEETYLRQEFSFFGCPRVCSVCALAYETLAIVSHHAPTPVPLIPLFHYFDVLMESFSLFLAQCTKIVRKIVHMAMQEIYFHTHTAPKHLESLKLVAHRESVILSFDIAKKIGHHCCKCIPCIQFCWLHCTDEGWIIQQYNIWGPSNTSALSFSSVIAGNFMHRYLKQSPFLSSAFANSFIKPNLMCSGVRRAFSGFTNGSYLIFFSPTRCSYYQLLQSHNCLLAILNRVQMTYASSGSQCYGEAAISSQ